MIDEQAFLQTILNSPNDTFLRLVFADWLEEQGDPRAELIRLLHILTQSLAVPHRDKIEERLRSLLEAGVQPVGPFVTNSLAMKFALIPPGTFLMGSPANEKQRRTDEHQHQVTLTKGFLMGTHPVTQAVWLEVMGNNPSRHTQLFYPDRPYSGDLPVERVSWADCQEFLRKLSKREGHSYRLPTEAEWEYACRAGTTTPYSFGATFTARHANSAGGPGEPTVVGSYPPNAWGLYDMHGNVWEWCTDWYAEYPDGDTVDPVGPETGELRVLRGGAFKPRESREADLIAASTLRSAYRGDPNRPTDHWFTNGFRVARTLPP